MLSSSLIYVSFVVTIILHTSISFCCWLRVYRSSPHFVLVLIICFVSFCSVPAAGVARRETTICPCTPSASASAAPAATAAVCPDCLLRSLAQMEPEAQALLLMSNPALMLDHLALSQYLLNEQQAQIHKQQQAQLHQQLLMQQQLQAQQVAQSSQVHQTLPQLHPTRK